MRTLLAFGLYPVLAMGNTIGSYSFTTNGSQVIINAYNDQGQFVYDATQSRFPAVICSAGACLTNTLYLDSAALRNGLNALPGNYSVVAENFTSPAIISSMSDQLMWSNCSQATCSGPAPANNLPLTISGGTLSGIVGDCSGPPRCTSQAGYSYAYAVTMTFNQPVYAVLGTFSSSAGFTTTSAGGDLPYPADLFENGSSTAGWIFPNGIEQITIDDIGVPGCDGCGLSGTVPFTLSDLLLGIDPPLPTPEPASWALAGWGVLLLIVYLLVRRLRAAPLPVRQRLISRLRPGTRPRSPTR